MLEWRGVTLPNATTPQNVLLMQALDSFRQQGKRLLFVTNNASKSRKKYVSKFHSLGLEVDASEVGKGALC